MITMLFFVSIVPSTSDFDFPHMPKFSVTFWMYLWLNAPQLNLPPTSKKRRKDYVISPLPFSLLVMLGKIAFLNTLYDWLEALGSHSFISILDFIYCRNFLLTLLHYFYISCVLGSAVIFFFFTHTHTHTYACMYVSWISWWG